jgi:hypothetical protein
MITLWIPLLKCRDISPIAAAGKLRLLQGALLILGIRASQITVLRETVKTACSFNWDQSGPI